MNTEHLNPNEDICFVMMPFGEAFDSYYKHIYEPAIESVGLRAKRADSLFRPSPIIRDIWQYINQSKILIADITGLNSNVMYELGLAHAISKPVIIISDSIESVPFDLRFLRILLYDVRDPNWSYLLKDKIIKSVKEIIDSPTDSILTAFLDIRPHIKETDQISAELIELKQLILSQINLEPIEVKKKITSETLMEASEHARKLYYAGWDISDIKHTLMDKYGFSSYTADDIFHRLT